MCKITMKQEKTTKNTVKFEEIANGKLTSPVIGTLYVPKATLKAMSWNEGDNISIDLGIVPAPAKAEKKQEKKTAKTTKKKVA